MPLNPVKELDRLTGSKELWLAVGGGTHADKVAPSIYFNGKCQSKHMFDKLNPQPA
jgi:hypothetical protein